MFTDLRNMKFILILVLSVSIVASGTCDNCTKINLRVQWSALIYNSEFINGKIFDEALNEAAFIRVMPNQKVRILCQDTIPNINRARILELISIGVDKIQPYTFQDLKNVFQLNLNDNNIEEIDNNTFHGLRRLTMLYLEHNVITSIHAEAFNGLKYLAILKLDHNSIRTINSDWFKNLNELKILDLSANEIEKLHEYTFKYKLKNSTIDLSHNKINFIHPLAFDGLEELDTLYLEHNKIKIIPEDAFSTLKHINKVDLKENKIECVTTWTKLLLKSNEINLDFNPWNCTCLEDFKNWASKNGINTSTEFAWTKCVFDRIRKMWNDKQR